MTNDKPKGRIYDERAVVRLDLTKTRQRHDRDENVSERQADDGRLDPPAEVREQHESGEG